MQFPLSMTEGRSNHDYQNRNTDHAFGARSGIGWLRWLTFFDTVGALASSAAGSATGLD
jgi:hypothetical protein